MGDGTQPTDGEPTHSDQVVYAEGWSEALIQANYAKTVIDTTGHFSTTRNACGKDAFGVLSVEDWNLFAKSLNEISKEGLSSNEYCVPAPEDVSRFMDGEVELKLDQGKKTLYQYKSYEICSNIQNHQVSDQLLQVINKIIAHADQEDCPNGWGS
jgi:hypothetical protein